MSTKTEDLLIKQGQIYKEKKDIKKSEIENEQLRSCTFRPEVNPMSQYLYDMKQQGLEQVYDGKFDQLHKEYIKRHQRQEEREQNIECTFHPKILRPPKVQEPLPFVDRMMKSANQKQIKLQELKIEQQIQQQNLDMQSTFQPKIGRAPLNRNQSNLAVHDYLYQKKDDKQIRQEILLKKELIQQQKDMVISLDKSSQIVEGIKKQKLFELFKQLDNDSDGQISSQSIDISQIPQNILDVIAPLLCIMEQNNFTFTFDTFYENTLKLISTQTIAQKDELFHNFSNKWDEKKSKYFQYEFKPVINDKSYRLARKRSYENFEGVYHHGMSQNIIKQERLNQMKGELAQRELDGCSFQPQLYKPMNIYPFTDPKKFAKDNNFFGVQNGFEIGDGQFRVTGIN